METGTFANSLTAPWLYRCAAKIAKQSKEGWASVKTLVYETNHPDVESLNELVFETLKRQRQIDCLIKKSQLFEKEPRFDPWLARILVNELIWRKKELQGECKQIKTILEYEKILKDHFSDTEALDDTVKVKKPRFVRVNTLKISFDDAVESFRDEGWTFTRFADSENYAGFLERVAGMSEKEFMADIHVDNLLIFPPCAQFYNHSGYLNGQWILQDKVSCFPAQLLNPPEGSIILDMCAAPGMKTTHLAAQINNKGKIFAVEINKKRSGTLRQMAEKTGASCVEVLNKDVITLFDQDIPDVEYILVDPSCSGSGNVDRIELKPNASTIEQRLKALASFQIKLLKHSLTNFPKAKRVVYSTNSIYSQENEDIVSEVIASCTGFKLLPIKDKLKAPWFNFASNEEGSIGSHCLYAKPENDLTNGFFVAVFERLKEGEENVFLKGGENIISATDKALESTDVIVNKDEDSGNKNIESNIAETVNNEFTSNDEKSLQTMEKKDELVTETIEKKRKGQKTIGENDTEDCVDKKKKKKGKKLNQ